MGLHTSAHLFETLCSGLQNVLHHCSRMMPSSDGFVSSKYLQLPSAVDTLHSLSATFRHYSSSLPDSLQSLIALYLRFLSTMFPALSNASHQHHGRMLYNVQTSSQGVWMTMLMGMASSFFIFGLTFLLYVIYIKWRWWHEMIVPRGFLGDKLAVKFRMDKIKHWMWDVIKMQEAEVIKHCGLDGAVFVRFFTVYIQLLIILNLTVLPTLAIMYGLGANPNGLTGMSTLSISNVNNQSTVLWATLACLYFETFLIFYLCLHHYAHVWKLRNKFTVDRSKELMVEEYTVMVTRIPTRLEIERHNKWFRWQSLLASIRPYLPLALFKKLPARGDDGSWDGSDDEMESGRCSGLQARGRGGEGVTGGNGEAGKSAEKGGNVIGYEGSGIGGGESGSERKLRRRFSYPRRLPVPPGKCFGGSGAGGAVSGGDNNEGESIAGEDATNGSSKLATSDDALGPLIEKGDGGDREAVGRSELAYAERFFRHLYGDAVAHVQPIYPFYIVGKHYHRWLNAHRQLNRARVRFLTAKQKNAAKKEEERVADEEGLRPKIKVGKFLGIFGGKPVDAFDYWSQQVEDATSALSNAQSEALSTPVPHAVFISFYTKRAATSAVQTIVTSLGSRFWRIEPARNRYELWWDNLHLSGWQRTYKGVIATAISVIVVFVFYIPVAFLASLVAGQYLGNVLVLLKTPERETWFYGMLASVLPSLALHSVFWIISPLYLTLGRWEGSVSFGQAMLVGSSRFYFCLLFNMFIGYSLTGSLSQALEQVLSGQITVSMLLATTIPETCNFFIQYTLNTIYMLGMELSRLPNHIVSYLCKCLIVGKDVARAERMWDQNGMAYHVFVGYQNLVMTFGIVYAVINPLILPCSLVYSFVGYFIWKHSVIYNYTLPAQTGGMYWPRYVSHLLIALAIGQFTVMGMFGIKQAYTQLGIASLLPLCTLVFTLYVNATYLSTYENLPYEDAADVDEYNHLNDQSVDPKDFHRAYFPDWLIPPHLHPMSQAGTARGIEEPWGQIWKYTRDLRNPDAYFDVVPEDWVPPPPPPKKGKKGGKGDKGVESGREGEGKGVEESHVPEKAGRHQV